MDKKKDYAYKLGYILATVIVFGLITCVVAVVVKFVSLVYMMF